jgi:hypothetical protein
MAVKGSTNKSLFDCIPDAVGAGFDVLRYDKTRDGKVEGPYTVTDGKFSMPEFLYDSDETQEGDDEVKSLPTKSGEFSLISKESNFGWRKKPELMREELGIHKKKTTLTFAYEDPFTILNAIALKDILGEGPKVVVWPGDGLRLQDKLPPSFLGNKWTGNKRNCPVIRFVDITTYEVKLHCLKQTFWCNALHQLMKPGTKFNLFATSEGNEHAQLVVARWAKTLWSRIKAFFKGRGDPLWRGDFRKKVYAVDEPRGMKSRSQRFLEMLKTVDGMFVQRFAVAPEEKWSWNKFDLFCIYNISFLLTDEFIDGGLVDEFPLDLTTCYDQLKRVRKLAKQFVHSNTVKQVNDQWDPNKVPHWIWYFNATIADIRAVPEGPRRAVLQGYISQTRGMGTPPPLLVLRSKIKFLKTVTTPPTEMTPFRRGLIESIAADYIDNLPDDIFTGLTTKAAINVSTAACFEKTRAEGGTVHAVKDIIHYYGFGEEVPIRCLQTGRILEWKHCENDESMTPGEYIFYASLDDCLTTDLETLKEVDVVVAVEPGKGRTVTKSRGCLKVVLDLINKIISWPLTKIKTSESGMGKAHHAWNLFKSFFRDENKDLIFHRKDRKQSDPRSEEDEQFLVEEVFDKAFAGCTDYSEATDFMQHKVASILGNRWMNRCGLPDILKGIVNAVCFSPRKAYFDGSGPLEKVGIPAPLPNRPNRRMVEMLCGLLMGDACTKVVLHLLNIGARQFGKKAHIPETFRPAFGGECYRIAAIFRKFLTE